MKRVALLALVALTAFQVVTVGAETAVALQTPCHTGMPGAARSRTSPARAQRPTQRTCRNGATVGHSNTNNAGHYGLPAVIGPMGLHEMRVPKPPKGFPERNFFTGWGAEGFLRNDYVVENGDYFGARYDPVRHRYLRGLAIYGTDSGFAAAGKGQSAWTRGGRMGVTWVGHSGFGWFPGKKFHGPRLRYTPVHGQSNGVAVGTNGKAWVAGWWVKNQYWGDWLDGNGKKNHAKGLPKLTPKGWSALFLMSPKTGVKRAIHAPANGPLTGVAIDKQYVWSIDPYTRCQNRGGRRECSRARLLRYDMTTRHFSIFRLPGTIRSKPIGDLYYETPMAAAPDGSVWAVVRSGPYQHGKYKHSQEVTLIGFRNGRFIQHQLWWIKRAPFYYYLGELQPMTDPQGRLWLDRMGTTWVINPRTWRTTKLRLKSGGVIQASDRTMWSVTGP